MRPLPCCIAGAQDSLYGHFKCICGQEWYIRVKGSMKKPADVAAGLIPAHGLRYDEKPIP